MIAFPISESSPVVYPGPAPSQTDVVVIGGGVIGTCTALYLARQNLRVVLLEKGRIAGEQSSRNWGWIRQQGRDLDEIPIMRRANFLWRQLNEQTNRDIGLKQIGITYMAKSLSDMERYAAWLERVKFTGVESRLLDGDALKRAFPALAQAGFVGALTTPSDMKAEPWVAVPALAEIAAREGVQIVENCAVRALDMVGGKVAGVVTEAGRISAPRVVLAAGAWSALFLRRHGVLLPQLSVRASVGATTDVDLPYGGAGSDGNVAFRPRADGGLSVAAGGFHELFVGPDALRAFPKYLTQLRQDPFGTRLKPMAPRHYPDAWTTPRQWSEDSISPFEAMRVLNPSPNMRKLRQVVRAISQRFPSAGNLGLKSAWAGMIDTMPDVVPVVDHVPALPGLVLGTGMSGHGFGIGPGMGEVLAKLVTEDDTGFDLSRFRFDRFTDGSPMIPGPAL